MDDHFTERPDAAAIDAARTDIIAFRQANLTSNAAELAVALVRARGSATSAEISTLLDLGPDQYPSVVLSKAVQNGLLVCEKRVWMLGPKVAAETRDSKPDAAASGPESVKRAEVAKAMEEGRQAAIENFGQKQGAPAPAAKAASRCRFAVWSDGRITIDTPSGLVRLTSDDFDALVQFVNRARP